MIAMCTHRSHRDKTTVLQCSNIRIGAFLQLRDSPGDFSASPELPAEERSPSPVSRDRARRIRARSASAA
jgi:hypothetical protein